MWSNWWGSTAIAPAGQLCRIRLCGTANLREKWRATSWNTAACSSLPRRQHPSGDGAHRRGMGLQKWKGSWWSAPHRAAAQKRLA